MKHWQNNSWVILIAVTSILLTISPAQSAEDFSTELGAPFVDGAILQRGMPLPVWGWSKPGAIISIEFSGQKKTATTKGDGKWMLNLDPLKANAQPQEMTITEADGNKRVLSNILIGEVWLASGQSNMQWLAQKCDAGMLLLKQIDARVKAGEELQPIIREAKVTNYFSALHPIEHANVTWSETYLDFSGIAFAFAYKLYSELNVPIGILNCSFSQTTIQAWTPRNGFAGGEDAYTKAIHKKILESDPEAIAHKTAWDTYYQSIDDVITENEILLSKGEAVNPVPEKTPGNLSSNRDPSWLFNARTNPMIPYAIRGAIWNQGYANSDEGLVYYQNLHSMIRGWREVWRRPDLPVYFHQFYSPKQNGDWDHTPSIGSMAEMRLGTFLARDIPHTAMASQIDITGAIHYRNKTLPGQRLALHALKNQYGKLVVTEGPMFKSYETKGEQLIVTLDNAEGGLIVAETGTNRKNNFAIPTVIPNGSDAVKTFYLADKNRVWHPAKAKISGNKVMLSSPAVKNPQGVSYGTGGIGNEPNIYNKSLLPTTPFIYFDQQLVTSKDWPDGKLKIAGEKIDPETVGKRYEYRKMPLLSTQFRENAVLQAGVPVTIWGSAVHHFGYEAEGTAEIKFNFAGIEKTIAVTPGMKEWNVVLPPVKASAEPNTLKVTFSIDGELVHERISKGIVFGDVYYVAAPAIDFTGEAQVKSKSIVRVMERKAKRFSFSRATRFSVAVSTTPLNRFASYWEDAADGFAAALGHQIGAKTGKPVGIILMQTDMTGKGKDRHNRIDLKSWFHPMDLQHAPSLIEDYENLAAKYPGNSFYNAEVARYVAAWKKYWGDYVPQMIETKRVPDGLPWGSYPSMGAKVETKASESFNVMVNSFTPTALKGIIFLSSEKMFQQHPEHYGAELSALANGWKKRFGNDNTHFYYTIPSKALSQKRSQPTAIKGQSTAIEIDAWNDQAVVLKLIESL